MRRILLPIGALGLLAGSAACGSAPPPPPAAPSPAPVASAPAPNMAGPDLSPVAEPPDVIGIFRWKNPMATLTTGAAGMPPQILEASGRVAAAEALKELFHGTGDAKRLADLVALDAPVDGVLTLDPNMKKKDVLAAFSIGLTSLDGAKQAVGGLVEVMPSVWKIAGSKHVHCVIAAAAGSAPARLVCGGHEKDLTALVPYMTRTLPTAAASPADLHAEFRLLPIDARYGDLFRQLLGQAPILARSELAFGDPIFDHAIVDAATGLADELGALSNDLDKLTFDLTASPSGISGTGSIVLRGKQSWTASGILEQADRAGAPPAIFFRVPKESDWAYFNRGVDPSRYAAMNKIVHNLIEGALAKVNIAPADRKAIADLWPPPMEKNAAAVCAGGHFDAPALPAGKKPTSQQAIDGVVAPLVGWTLCGSDTPPATEAKYLKDLVAAYNRAGVLGTMKKALGPQDAKHLPTVKSVAAPAALGAGAVDIEVTIPDLDLQLVKAKPEKGKNAKAGAAKGDKGKLTLHLLMMADGNRSWAAVGLAKDELVKQLLAAKTGAADAGTLASREGLDALKNGKTMSGGFMTMAGLVKSFTSTFDRLKAIEPEPPPPELSQLMTTIASLPNHGRTPILFETTASTTAPTHADFTFVIPKGALQDATAITTMAAQLAGSAVKKFEDDARPLP